eukprot:6196377-Pleurochrysis_carterae.AAC.1
MPIIAVAVHRTGVSHTPERENGHHTRFDAGETLIGRDGAVWWSSRSIRSSEFHDAPDGSLSDAVKLMNVRGACSGVHAFVSEKFSELAREKLPCIVAVDSPYHTCRGVATFVEQSPEASEEESNVFGRFVLVTQHVNGLEPGVIVDDHKCVTAPSIDGGDEWSGYVYVNETARARGICFSAGRARGRQRVAQTPRSVSSEVCELFEARVAAMKPAMHVMCCLVGSHYLNVRCRTRGVNGECARAGGARFTASYMPFE